MPITMEGTPLSTSAVKRMALARSGAAAELGEVDASGDADGNAHEAGKGEDDSGADDGVGHAAALFTNRGGDVGEEGQIEGACAFVDEVGENGDAAG